MRGLQVEGSVHNLFGNLDQPLAVVAGILTQDREGLFHVDGVGESDDALGLLDQNAATERALQLRPSHAALPDGAFLKNADGGGVGQRLDRAQVLRSQTAEAIPEDIERSDGRRSQPQGDRMHRLEAKFERSRPEPWPRRGEDIEGGNGHG